MLFLNWHSSFIFEIYKRIWSDMQFCHWHVSHCMIYGYSADRCAIKNDTGQASLSIRNILKTHFDGNQSNSQMEFNFRNRTGTCSPQSPFVFVYLNWYSYGEYYIYSLFCAAFAYICCIKPTGLEVKCITSIWRMFHSLLVYLVFFFLRNCTR